MFYYGYCYKYRDFKKKNYLEQLIVERKMMFSPPADFNDPYDCRPTHTLPGNPAKARKHIGKAWEEARIRNNGKKPSSAERSQHISKIMQELSTEEGATKHFSKLLMSRLGVFCMSESWKILTQWAYYADNSTGLCLEFRVHPDTEFHRIYRMNYSNQRPKVDIVQSLYDDNYRNSKLLNAATHKALDWSSEKEVRAMHKQPGIRQYPDGMLESIMVEQEAETDDVVWLQKMLAAHQMSIPIYRIKLCAQTFDLERQLM